jgi:hypothetical protein
MRFQALDQRAHPGHGMSDALEQESRIAEACLEQGSAEHG